jgi:hypothetical protein
MPCKFLKHLGGPRLVCIRQFWFDMISGEPVALEKAIFLGKLTSVGLFSDGYQFRVLNPGYKPKDITSLKDFSTSIVLEPTK